MLWITSVLLRHVFSSLYHQHLHSHTFSTMVPLRHPVTLFHTVVCSTYPPPCPATPIPPTHSFPLLLPAQPIRVRTCRLPLIWVSAIQFSGRYKPAQYHTPPPPPQPQPPPLISLTYPGHETCRQPHMVLKVPPHRPLPPHRYP